MLDTFKFELSSPLLVPGQCQIPLPLGKYVRCWVDPIKRYLTRVECSLPKLLFGHNGRLIATQEELNRALTMLGAEVAKIAEVPDLADWVPSRGDLVWQIGGLNAGKVVDVLAGFRFPGIQKPAMHVAGQSSIWRGGHSRFVVSAYDKAKQLRVPGDVLRVEVRLCGRVLRDRLEGRDWRSFADLYAIYREVILSLPNVPKASTEHSLLTAVTKVAGPEVAEQVLLLMNRRSETIRKYRREIHIAAADLPSKLVWAEIFPPAAPPAPVSIEPHRRRANFQCRSRFRTGYSGELRKAIPRTPWSGEHKVRLQPAV
jgi:hypothetical protein